MSEHSIPSPFPELDCRQRDAVMASHNVVVTAGAGAGKTTVLVSRYLKLVMTDRIPVRSILALTFTRKAAAEMYGRIYQRLATLRDSWAFEQLSDFRNAHITTLDAFCSEIVRQASADYGYGSGFGIDAERSADLARTIASDYVMRHRNEPGLTEILSCFPYDDVVFRLFADAGAAYVTPTALAEPVFAPMEEGLNRVFRAHYRSLSDDLKQLSTDILAESAHISAPKTDCALAISRAREYSDWHEKERRGDQESPNRSPEPSHGGLSVLIENFTTLAFRSYARAESEQAVKELAKKAKEVAAKLLSLARYESHAPVHRALLARLDEFAKELAEAKRMADVMDFKDLGACAVRTLRLRKDIRQDWKSRISSIMIDEFQDNNELQKELLFYLAEKSDRSGDSIPAPSDLEEGKLFFVGDEKQSIYRFRGADVSVFRTLAEDLETSSGTGALMLPSNYRSASPLIAFFNRFFDRVFGARIDGRELENFDARYSGMDAGNPAGQNPSFEPRIRYFHIAAAPTDEEEAESDMADQNEDEFLGGDDSLAFEVAHFIKESAGTLEVRAPGSAGLSSRTAVFEDFAILLRTTTHQHRLEKYLRALGVPFESESPRGLFREAPANDIYNILKLAENPDDKSAYASVLRSPLCRLGDSAFFELMASKEGPFIPENPETLDESDKEALSRARIFFEDLRSLSRSHSLSEIVEYVWNEGGMRMDILSRPEAHAYLEHFDYIFHMSAAIDAKKGGIPEFLETLAPYIEAAEEKVEFENVPRVAPRGVRIMTIHKSKGLQFPIVIIPWVESVSIAKRSQALWHAFPEGIVIDLKPYDQPGAKSTNVFFDLAKETENRKNVAEIRRLLYVACTRAEDHLIFFGKEPYYANTSGGSFKYYLDAYLANSEYSREDRSLQLISLAPRRNFFVSALRTRPAPPDISAFAEAYRKVPLLRRRFGRIKYSATDLNARALELRASAPDRPRSFEDRITSSGEDSSSQVSIKPEIFGILCHELAEFAVKTGGVEGFKPAERALRSLSGAEYNSALPLAEQFATGFLNSPFFSGLPAEAKVSTEKSFILDLGEHSVEGRMDLFIETSDVVFIIDFKSDQHREPEEYEVQLACYRQAAQKFAPGKSVKTGLFWLRSATLDWLQRDIAPEELIQLARMDTLCDQ